VVNEHLQVLLWKLFLLFSLILGSVYATRGFFVSMLAESMRGICASGNAPDEICCRYIRCGDNLSSCGLDSTWFAMHHLLILLPVSDS
jgi:hypothetical protein